MRINKKQIICSPQGRTILFARRFSKVKRKNFMSIFSLQTKKHLVGWGVGFGIVLNFVISLFTAKVNYFSVYFGFPIKIYDSITALDFKESIWYALKGYFSFFTYPNMIINQVFWFLISLIILSLIRYFKKNQEVKSK